MPIATVVETEQLGLLPTKQALKQMRRNAPLSVGVRTSTLAHLTNQARVQQAAFAREQTLRTLTSPVQATSTVATLASSLVNPLKATASHLAPKGFTRLGSGAPAPRGAQVDLLIKARANQALAKRAVAEGRTAEAYSRGVTASAQVRQAALLNRQANIEEASVRRLWQIASTSYAPSSFGPHRYDPALAGLGDVWGDATRAIEKAAKDVARATSGAFESATDTIRDQACKQLSSTVNFKPPARKAGETQEAYEARVKQAWAKESAKALGAGFCVQKKQPNLTPKPGPTPPATPATPAKKSKAGAIVAALGAAFFFLR